MYRTYVVFRAPQLVTVDGVDVTEEVSLGWLAVLWGVCKRTNGMTRMRPCGALEYLHTFLAPW